MCVPYALISVTVDDDTPEGGTDDVPEGGEVKFIIGLVSNWKFSLLKL